MIRLLDDTYQIVNTIGHGGTGTVYLAYHIRLEKYVIIKQLTGIRDPSQIRTEVDILKGLHHPNLPQVYDFIVSDGNVYTVMDYIEGTDLSVVIGSGMRCSTEQVLHWFRQMTEVLIYLHGQEPPVIHSDIKPANIIINSRGDAVLIDFNISVSGLHDTIKGLSLDYASPEQISVMQCQKAGVWTRETVDERSDIYSLCAAFAYLISGERPSFFYGHTPLTEETTGYPEAFCQILEKGMNPEQAYRYQTAGEMLAALDRIWKKTSGFKIYVVLQILVILVTALLAGYGGVKILTGIRTETESNLINEYNRCIQVVNGSDPEEAFLQCSDFLNRNENLLEDHPALKGGALEGLAESCFALENYEDAAKYYAQAEEFFSDDEVRLSELYYGEVISRMKNGETGKAEYAIDSAQASGVSGERLLLLEVQLASLKGDYKACTEYLKKLEATSRDKDILIRAYIAAGEAAPDPEQKKQWLLKAAGTYSGDTDVLRALGHLLLETADAADEAGGENAKLIQACISCYQIVCRDETAGLNDFLNLSEAYLLAGKYNEAIETLTGLENSKIPENYENIEYIRKLISLQKAVAYHAKGDSLHAKEAIAYAADLAGKGNLDSEMENSLRLLKDYYGV